MSQAIFKKQNLNFTDSKIMGKLKLPYKGKKVLIVGGGVIGITIAYVLLSQGCQVTLVARDLPSDSTSKQFCSPWAGAIWLPFEDEWTGPISKWEKTTFLFWQLIKGSSIEEIKSKIDEDVDFELIQSLIDHLPIIPDNIMAYSLTKLYTQKDEKDDDLKQISWWKDFVLNFKLTKEYQEFKTISIHPINYLKILIDRLSNCERFKIHKVKIDSLFQAKVDFLPNADIIINASGLGSKMLIDVKDENVEPIRGQTVVIRRRHIHNHQQESSSSSNQIQSFFVRNHHVDSKSDQMTYCIARANSGEFLLGGTSEYGIYDLNPNQQQIDRIIRENKKYFPKLFLSGDDDNKANDNDLSNKNIGIIQTPVGLRPGRKGGARLELIKSENNKQITPIIHAYGFGKIGFQASWGVALEVSKLLRKI